MSEPRKRLFDHPAFKSLEIAAVLAAVITFLVEISERRSSRIHEAWSLVYQSRDSGGSGLKSALEFLVSNGESLSNMDLREAYLLGVQVPHAQLDDANFGHFGDSELGVLRSGAILSGANLRGTKLRNADLRGANLVGADLRCANMTDVKFNPLSKLTGAHLASVECEQLDPGAELMPEYSELHCWSQEVSNTGVFPCEGERKCSGTLGR